MNDSRTPSLDFSKLFGNLPIAGFGGGEKKSEKNESSDSHKKKDDKKAKSSKKEYPCSSSSCGRMIYIQQDNNYRTYPGSIRGTEEWDNTYKIRTVIEREINHIKENLCLAGRRTQNEKTLHADLILAGITQLITVVLADKIKHLEYIRSLKPLIA